MNFKTILAGLTALGLLSGTANADLIEVGAGVRNDFNGTTEVLLVANFGGLDIGQNDGAVIYVAKVESTVVVSAFGEDAPTSNGFKVSIRPFGAYSRTILNRADIALFPMEIERDQRLNRDMSFKIRAVGFKANGIVAADKGTLVIASLAVEALGYKMRDYLEGSTFHGVDLLDVSGEIGLAWGVGSHSAVQLVAGGSAELGLGGSDGFALETEESAYLALRFNITKFFQLYAQTGVTWAGDTGNGNFSTVGEFLAGAKVVF